MLLLLILAALTATLSCAILLRHGRRIARRYSLDMPQRFHAGHVPRLGGAAMLTGCLVGWAWLSAADRFSLVVNNIPLDPWTAGAWAAAVVIAVAGGLAEDIWHRFGATWRLSLTLLAGVAAVGLLNLRIPDLGVPQLAQAWTVTPWPAIALAVFAVAGLPHAFNLIDGYNGLAGTVALVCCFAIAYVALQVGDRQLAALVLALAGATAGFLVWNFPRGLLFAGDGGAYLWGAVIAIACIQLVQRHDIVSPWFPMLLLIYPVWETVFSIYRKLMRGQSPGVADALHFHQLIYRRIVRHVFVEDEARRMLARNNRTSPYLWGFSLMTVVPSLLFWKSTPILMAFCALFIFSYVYAYRSIVRFRVPRWVSRRNDGSRE